MNAFTPLPRSFYERNTTVIARELLGKLLVKKEKDEFIVGRIVEDEAYRGEDDPASHAYKGKTPRNRIMFEKPGFSYVYFVYGNHYCFNATTEREGDPGAVLIRAVEIIQGVPFAYRNRPVKSLTELTNGPGKLTQAFGITKIHNGLDLTSSTVLSICRPITNEDSSIRWSKRIGIKTGCELPWRFFIEDSKFLSK